MRWRHDQDLLIKLKIVIKYNGRIPMLEKLIEGHTLKWQFIAGFMFFVHFGIFENIYKKYYFYSEKIHLWVVNLELKHYSPDPGSRVFKN